MLLQIGLFTRREVEDWDVVLYFGEWAVKHHFITLRVSDAAGEPRIDPLVRGSRIEEKRRVAKVRVRIYDDFGVLVCFKHGRVGLHNRLRCQKFGIIAAIAGWQLKGHNAAKQIILKS